MEIHTRVAQAGVNQMAYVVLFLLRGNPVTKLLFSAKSANRVKSQEHIPPIKQANILLLLHSFQDPNRSALYNQRTRTKSNAADTVQRTPSLCAHPL